MPTAGGFGGLSAGYERIISTLDRLALERHDGGWGVRELAEVLDEGKSSINRVLLALTEEGMAERVGTGNYRAGPRLRVLADRLLTTHPLVAAAQPVIAELSARCDATAIVAVHDWPLPQSFVAVYCDAGGPVRYNLDPGTVLPLHAGAAGQAILSALGVDALPPHLDAFTPDTVTDRAAIRARIAEIRERGYAMSIGQHFQLAAGIAVPMRVNGLAAAISVTRSRYNTDTADLERFAPLVTHSSREVVRAAASETSATSPPTALAVGSGSDESTGSGSATARFERLMAGLIATPEGLPPIGRELGRRLAVNRATATKLLDAALNCGLAVSYAGRFVTGPRLLHWASALRPDHDRTSIVAALIRETAADISEAVGFTEYRSDTGTAVMTYVAAGPTPLHYGLNTGVSMPLHAGAASKAILAYLPESTLDALTLEPITENTITDRTALIENLREINTRGWAFGDGERIPDAAGIAVPYFIDGIIAGSITATIPRYRITHVEPPSIAAALQNAATRLTKLLSVGTYG